MHTAQSASPGALHPVERLIKMPDPKPIEPLPARPVLTPRTPVDLWDAVVSARVALAEERVSPRAHQQLSARAALVDALEAYILSLSARGHPVPYALRDEVRLQKTLRRSTPRGPG
jgi:hypothetical protein